MKNLQSLALGLVLLGTATGATAQLGLNEGPMIWFKDRIIDFGQMKQADHATHTFKFENRGTQPLAILKIETSCGCTAAAPADSLILPGASSGIEVTFSSRDFEGEHSKTVIVRTNDPAEPRIDLTLLADIIPFIRQDREWIDFGRTEVGTARTEAALITADLGSEFAIPAIHGGESVVEWKIIPASVPDEIGYRIEASLRPDAPLGNFTERIEIDVHHPSRQKARIGLRGTVFSHFILESSKLKFKTIAYGKTVRRSLKIEAGSSADYEITEVILHSQYLTPTLKRTESGYELEVTLATEKLKYEGTRHPFTDYVRLITNDPRQPEIVIPISGVLRKR